MPTWDPTLYRRFSSDRDRPFFDLIARIDPSQELAPERVVDLGCGEGSLTAALADRWPGADIVGVDSSAEMTAAASAHAGHRLSFETGDLREWIEHTPAGSVDVIVSNAALQWVPGHLDLVPGLLSRLRPGGWLAIQVPGNHDAPSHRLLRYLATSEPYAPHTGDIAARPILPDPTDYLAVAAPVSDHSDVWESTYQHVLPGEDPVFTWISGTGARPVLQALPADLREQFEQTYRSHLRQAYPSQDYGGAQMTVLPFRRVFAVFRRAS